MDRVVASDCRKDWFESSHGQSFAEHLILLHFMYPGRKDKTKEKEAVNGPLKKPFKTDYHRVGDPCIKINSLIFA